MLNSVTPFSWRVTSGLGALRAPVARLLSAFRLGGPSSPQSSRSYLAIPPTLTPVRNICLGVRLAVMETAPYAAELHALAAELLAIATSAPDVAMMALGRLVDHVDTGGAMARLRAARRVAAQAAVDDAGSQAKLARLLGVSETLVSRAVRDVRRR